MANDIDIRASAFLGSSKTLLARVVGADAQPIQQADIASILYSVYKLDGNDPESREVVSGHSAATIAVADAVFDTLQTDARWTRDATGYNFAWTLDVSAAAAFPQIGDYLVEILLTPANGQVIMLRFRLKVI